VVQCHYDTLFNSRDVLIGGIDMAQVSDTLRVLRMERDMTQEDVANRLNISRFSVANYETGRRNPSVGLLTKYAEIFHLSMDDLISTDYQTHTMSLMQLAERVFTDKDMPQKQKDTMFMDIMKCYMQNKEK